MNTMLPAAKNWLSDLRGRVLSLFDRWTPGTTDTASALPEPLAWPGLFSAFGWPAVDLIESDDRITVHAELPGLEENNFSVEVIDRHLILRGEKQTTQREKRNGYEYTESRAGAFYRAVPLPADVDRDRAKASYKRGILTVDLPKAQTDAALRVPISAA